MNKSPIFLLDITKKKAFYEDIINAGPLQSILITNLF